MKINYNGIVRDMTPEEEAEYLAAQKSMMPYEIEGLKQQLAETDYKALKWAEGWLTDEEYAPIKAERQAIRDRINQLETEVSQNG